MPRFGGRGTEVGGTSPAGRGSLSPSYCVPWLVLFPLRQSAPGGGGGGGGDFHNLVTLIAAVTGSIEINFDFFLFLLSAANVTNGIIFGFSLEQCSWWRCEPRWPGFLLGDHWLSRAGGLGGSVEGISEKRGSFSQSFPAWGP